MVANQQVKRGDPLVRLDQRQYQAVLDQSQATIDGREADIQRVQADTLQQMAQLAQARAQADVARINLAHARDAVERYTPLAVTGATTDEHLADLRTRATRPRPIPPPAWPRSTPCRASSRPARPRRRSRARR